MKGLLQEDIYFFHDGAQLPLYTRVGTALVDRYVALLESQGWRRVTEQEHHRFVDRENLRRWRRNKKLAGEEKGNG